MAATPFKKYFSYQYIMMISFIMEEITVAVTSETLRPSVSYQQTPSHTVVSNTPLHKYSQTCKPYLW